MNKDEALKIALDYIRRTSHWEKGRDRHDTLKAVEAALAQPAQDRCPHGVWIADYCYKCNQPQPEQEPVGFMNAGHVYELQQKRITYGYVYPKKEIGASVAVYTTPQHTATWVGLTDEEIDEGNKQSWVTKQAWESAVWWASETLKEKNNG